MRKTLATFVLLTVFLIGLPLSADAQCRYRKRAYRDRSYSSQRYYAPSRRYYVQQRRPSFYRRHRNLINLGIGTGAGALVGGIAGGKKGAGVGALVGLGGSALYTYYLNKKKRRY